ncbi:MAG: hypothetical protein ABIJ96_10715 [Elusimicrobiota bacterium]
MVDVLKQNFVIARLADYCNFSQSFERAGTRDPIAYLWGKLREIEQPLLDLKQELLEDSVRRFFTDLNRDKASESTLADLLQLLDSYLSRGDFADAAFHLDWGSLQDPSRRQHAWDFIQPLQAHSLLDEDDKPAEQRGKNWERIVGDIRKRLGYDVIERCHARKPLTARRLRFFLRRARFQSADFCAVFRFPIHEGDTFTPFILPRVEGLIAANRRLLQMLRKRPS